MRLKEYMTLDGCLEPRRPTRGHARGTTHGSSRGAKVRFTGLAATAAHCVVRFRVILPLKF
jgi:hypothetical protein